MSRTLEELDNVVRQLSQAWAANHYASTVLAAAIGTLAGGKEALRAPLVEAYAAARRGRQREHDISDRAMKILAEYAEKAGISDFPPPET